MIWFVQMPIFSVINESANKILNVFYLTQLFLKFLFIPDSPVCLKNPAGLFGCLYGFFKIIWGGILIDQ